MMMRAIGAFGVMCAIAGLLAGCGGGYYRVNDPAGTKQYYTTDIDQTKSGAITFKDQKTGSVVTLQSSEVKEISEEEFTTAVKPEEKKGDAKTSK